VYMVWGSGCWVSGVRFRVQCLGVGVWASGFRIRVLDFRFRIQG